MDFLYSLGPYDAKATEKLLKLRPKLYRMYTDDSFFDVSSSDVKDLLKFLNRNRTPNVDKMRIREKYKAFLKNETGGIQGVINRFGLRFPEHVVCYQDFSGSKVRINGYTVEQWNLLTNEDYTALPPLHAITRFVNGCVASGDTATLEVLKTRFGSELEERERNRAAKIFLEHNLPPDTKYSQLDNLHIDGITFNCWRLLNDDSYEPSKAILISNHHFLKKSCRKDDVSFIEDKYHSILFPKDRFYIPEEEIEAARDIFADIHAWPPPNWN